MEAENLIKQLNVTNAKKIAVIVVLGFIIYHGIIHIRFGTDSCQWLLTKGRFKGDKEWQPYGCMMHKYSQTDTRRCFRYLAFWGNKNHFIFIGNYRLRMLYQTFINHFSPHTDDNQSISLLESKKNANFLEYKLKLKATYFYADEVNKQLLEKLEQFEKETEPISTYILGITGLSHSNFLKGNTSELLFQEYEKNLTQLLEPLGKLTAKKSNVLWKLQDRVSEEKLNDEWKNVMNTDIDKYNKIARMVFKSSKSTKNITIWESSSQIANGLLDQAINGYKLTALGLRHDMQIILNMYCNDYMSYNDGTCCSSPEPNSMVQIVTYSIFGVFVVLALAIITHKFILYIQGYTFYSPLEQTSNQGTLITDLTTPIYGLANLGLILAYYYLCDRTNFFMKENKYYSEFSFWIPVGYVFALGLFFTEDSRFTKVLNRDQTDELKGWMILVILIYNMTGADRILTIHMHIKVLISAYLFLAGYQHFTYVWQTGNAGLVRFFQVLFKKNFMTIILCFCMNRPYQFYYFVPLISFWVCIIYFLLGLPPHTNAQSCEINNYYYLYLVLKFVFLLSVITILYLSEVFFERIFVTRPWKALFVNSDDSIHEWWTDFKLDRYTITYGMVFAALFHIAQKYNIFDDNNHGNLFSRRISLTITLAALIGLGFYTTFTFLCRSQLNCEEIHSYIVFIPIISYIILRNISGILRTRYSTFFSWFGKISLELFICQYHGWLAADRHGVLVLLPGFPTLNMIITSFIFITSSHEVHRLTQILLPYLVPNDLKICIRNFVFFLIILIPIGRSDGMF